MIGTRSMVCTTETRYVWLHLLCFPRQRGVVSWHDHVPAERSRRKICALKVCCVDGLSIRLAPLAGNSTRGWHSGTNIHTTVVRYVVLMRRRSEYDGLNFNINGTLLSRVAPPPWDSTQSRHISTDIFTTSLQYIYLLKKGPVYDHQRQ